ncbi:MAG: hypothetical protein Q9181_006624 [Wetmoreana brouardii]
MHDLEPALVTSGASFIHRRQPAIANSAPYYANISAVPLSPDPCSISYTPTVTPLCAVTLTSAGAPIGSTTACDPLVTFSTDHGYRLVATRLSANGGTSTVPAIETLTTYLAANAKSLATGLPTGLVQAETCSEGRCSSQWERWTPITTQAIQVSNSTLQVTAVVTRVSPLPFAPPSSIGLRLIAYVHTVQPAQIIVGPVTVTRNIEVVPMAVSVSTVVQVTRTVTRIEISRSTVSQPATTPLTYSSLNNDQDDDDDDEFTSTTTRTSTVTNFRTIQTASVEQY